MVLLIMQNHFLLLDKGVVKIKRRLIYVMLMFAMINPYYTSSFASNFNDIDISNKRVLFISSYSPSFETFFKQVEGLKSVLDKNRVTLDIEFMDSKRFHSDENYENFYESLKYKMGNIEKYDVIIVGDDNALTFITVNRDIFEDIPVVYLGINDIEKAKTLSENSNITGIYEAVSISGTIELAHNLKPDAQRVVALVDNTVTGQAVKKQYDLVASESDGLAFDSIDLSKTSFMEFQLSLEELSEEDIVLLIAVRQDITGEVISFREGIDLIFQSTD